MLLERALCTNLHSNPGSRRIEIRIRRGCTTVYYSSSGSKKLDADHGTVYFLGIALFYFFISEIHVNVQVQW